MSLLNSSRTGAVFSSAPQRNNLLILVSCGAVALFFVPNARGDDVVVAIKQADLFARLGVQPDNRWPRSLGRMGMTYRLTPTTAGLDVTFLTIGVFPTVPDAQRWRLDGTRLASIPPTRGFATSLGDDRLVWTDSDGSRGTLKFRRKNVCIHLNWHGQWSQLQSFVEAIDDAIQNDRQIAPLGQFSEGPQIELESPPSTLARAARRVVIAPIFRGLGDASRVRLAVFADDDCATINETDGEGRPLRKIAVPAPGKGMEWKNPPTDGRFVLRVPETIGPTKLTLVAANDDNVIVTKTIEVNVVSGQ
jgi:hypothetical protein